MGVYDQAHRIARLIKDSEEYQDYQTIRKVILADKNSREMLKDFRQEEFKLQAKQFSGQEITEADKEKINNLRDIINLNNKVKKYIEAEYRIGVMLNDLQEIIFSDLEIGLEEEDEEDNMTENEEKEQVEIKDDKE